MCMLFHKTVTYAKDSILKTGLTWKGREDISWFHSCNDYAYKLLNQCRPTNKYCVNMEKCIFFCFEENIDQIHWRPVTFQINSKDLDKDKLFAAPFNVTGAIVNLLNSDYSIEDVKKIATIYWDNVFTFDNYLNNMDEIKDTFLNKYKLEYVPEVIYTDEIPKELVKLYSCDDSLWSFFF